MNDLVNQIAEGKAELLTADEICKRLAVSRSTFDRWVKNGTTQYIGNRPKLFTKPDDEDTSMQFPPADIRIGQSPRWSVDTFKKWLHANLNANAQAAKVSPVTHEGYRG